MKGKGEPKWINRVTGFINRLDRKKVSYLMVLLVAGIILMLFSNWLGNDFFSGGAANPGEGATRSPTAAGDSASYAEGGEAAGFAYAKERELETRLERIFTLIENVGRVRVMLSLAGEREYVYASDASISESYARETDSQGGSRETRSKNSQGKTIIMTDRSGEERPLVLREIEPTVAGVIIIAEGGDNVFVQDALTKAACAVLGIEANKVQVLKYHMKMKGE